MGKMDPFVSWMAQEVEGIQKILRLIAPRYRLLGSEVLTLPPEVGALGGGQGGVQRAPNDPSGSREWADLPAITPAVGKPPLVAPNRPFAASLAAENPPPPILAPLSHGRGLEAPSGIALGVAKPVAMAPGAPTPPAVQRSPLRARPAAGPDAMVFEASASPEAEIIPDRARLAVASESVSKPAPSLLRSSGAGVAASPPGLVLPPRAAGSVTQPGPAVQRSPAAPAIEAPTEQRRAARAPDPAPSLGETGRGRGIGPGRMNLGQSRRLGLGAPIGSVPTGSLEAGQAPAAPAMPLVQRAPAPSAPEPEPALAASGGVAGTTEPSAPGTTPGPAVPQASPAAHAPSPSVVTPAAATSAGARDRLSSTGAADAARPPLAPGARSELRGSVPITSARPLRIAIQRSSLTKALPGQQAAAPAGTGSSASTGSAAKDGPVKVRRDQSAGDLSKSLDARSFTHGGEIFLPSSHGPLNSGTGKALLAHELTHVTQQRRMGSSLPDERSPHGQRLEAEAVAAERSGQLPLASGHAGHDHGEAAPTARAGAPTSSGSAGPRPQRAGVSGAAAQPEIAPSGSTTIDFSAIQRAPVAPEPPKTSGTENRTYSEPELEDLARQLHGRIGRMLRRELLVDRERAGLAMDIR